MPDVLIVADTIHADDVSGDDVVRFDLFPRDRASACYADFTRTFSLGPPSDELAGYHRLAKEALDLAVAAVKPGVRSTGAGSRRPERSRASSSAPSRRSR